MAYDASFWAWALQRWQTPGIEGQLIALQDEHGLVILEMLFLAWLGTTGRILSRDRWQHMIDRADPWVVSVVQPLRAQRRAWSDSPEHRTLKASLKVLEVAAERELAKIYVGAMDLSDMASLKQTDEKTDKVANATFCNLQLGAARAAPPLDTVDVSRLAGLLSIDCSSAV